MMMRSQRSNPIILRAHHAEDADITTTDIDPHEIARMRANAALALAQIPDLVCNSWPEEDGSISIHLGEAGNPEGSWAACDSSEDGKHLVTQFGPRRLWDEVEKIFGAWLNAGEPGNDKFELFVTPEEQVVRCVGIPT
jgi:hypothetical protein